MASIDCLHLTRLQMSSAPNTQFHESTFCFSRSMAWLALFRALLHELSRSTSVTLRSTFSSDWIKDRIALTKRLKSSHAADRSLMMIRTVGFSRIVRSMSIMASSKTFARS